MTGRRALALENLPAGTPCPPAAAPGVSVVVPVYNGAKTLDSLVQRLCAVLQQRPDGFEVLLVNDGSRDDSWARIAALAARHPEVRGLDLMRNYGQHNALLAGIQQAAGALIVTLDDDLQHPPEAIPALLDALEQGFDLVYGKPLQRQHAGWRKLGSRALRLALRTALGAELAEQTSAFRAFRAELKQGFERFTDAQVYLDVLLSWSARQVRTVSVPHHERAQGQSGYNLRKLLSLALNMVTAYSPLPLRLAALMGLASACFGIVLFVYVVVQRLGQQDYVPGFAFLAASIALFAGMQLLALGVIGEYLARVHFRTLGQPAYVVRTHTGDSHTTLSKTA